MATRLTGIAVPGTRRAAAPGAVAPPVVGPYLSSDRAALMHLGLPWRNLLPVPNGELDVLDRMMLLATYGGLIIPSAGLTLDGLLEQIGGARVYTLFDLSVTHPFPKTWYLATADLTTPVADVLTGTRYQGLVREHSAVAASAAMGGVGGEGGVTLTLINSLGTGGPGRKFMDAFAKNAPDASEPYDLLTATLQCRLYWPRLPGEPVPIGTALAILPEGFEWVSEPGQPEAVRLTFGPDQRRYRPLPRNVVTTKRYPHAPDTSVGQPVVPWFGQGLRVPCVALDADGGLYLIGASPTATPLGGVTDLWTIRPDPGSDESQPVALPVQITTAGQVLVSIPATVTGDIVLKQVAQRLELGPKGAFGYGVRLWLKRASATACVGDITLSVVLDEDGLPGATLVDRAATAVVNAAIVTTGTYAAYDIPFQGNEVARAAYLLGRRAVWVVAKLAKTSGGDLHIQIDTSGAYTAGILATQDSTTDDEWKLTGKQARVGPVRLDFTGLGMLFRDDATGTITTKAPVTVPGL